MIDLFMDCLTCDNCFNDDLLNIPDDIRYLPTPWQGEISKKVKVLFIGINPSPTKISDAKDEYQQDYLDNITRAIEDGYSMPYTSFHEMENNDDPRLEGLLGEIFRTMTTANIRKDLPRNVKRRSSYFGYAKHVTSCLLHREKCGNVEEFVDFIGTDLIHCQTPARADIGEDFETVAQKCFNSHTRGILNSLENNLQWIVISLKNDQANSLLNSPAFSEGIRETFGNFVTPTTLVNNNEKLLYSVINNRLKILITPFLGTGQFKERYYHDLCVCNFN